MQPFEWSLLAAAVLLVCELLTGTFVLMSFAAGCLAVAALQAYRGTFHGPVDLVVMIGVAIVTLMVLRVSFRRAGDVTHVQGDVNDY